MTTLDSGRIVDIRNRRAFIEITKDASCSDCGHCSKGGDNTEMLIQVPLDKGHLADGKEVHAGDAVRMECRTFNPAVMGLLYFMVPLSLSIAGYIVGSSLFASMGIRAVNAFSIAVSLFLFVLPYLVLFILRKRKEKQGKRWIRIVEVIKGDGAAVPRGKSGNAEKGSCCG